MGISLRRSFKLEIENREVFGLDIGSSSVNAVQLLKKGKKWVIKAAGRATIAPNQEEDDQTNTVNAISQCLKSTGIRTRKAVCGISGPEVAVRDFQFPSLSREEIESAIHFEAAQVCPFNADDTTVDYQLIERGRDDVRGILVAATNELINYKTKLAKKALVDCVLMDVDGLALLNCLSECEDIAEQTTAVLNVGCSYTTLTVLGGRDASALPFIRNVSYAGNDIVTAVATENNMSEEAVREILLGGKEAKERPNAFEESFEKACDKLIVDVTESLRYYTAQDKSSFVEKIFVCGGFAMIEGLVDLLDRHLPSKVILWNPLEKLLCVGDKSCEKILREDGPAMAVATGLAMRSI